MSDQTNRDDDAPSDRSAPEPVTPDPLDEPVPDEPGPAPEPGTDGPLDVHPDPGHLPSETGVQAERQPLDSGPD